MEIPGTGKPRHISLTSSFTWAWSALSSMFDMTLSIHCAMRSISGSFIPLVVIAGVPSLIPEGSNGDRGSPGTVFLLRVIPTSSRASWACFPGTFLFVRSMSSR